MKKITETIEFYEPEDCQDCPFYRYDYWSQENECNHPKSTSGVAQYWGIYRDCPLGLGLDRT